MHRTQLLIVLATTNYIFFQLGWLGEKESRFLTSCLNILNITRYYRHGVDPPDCGCSPGPRQTGLTCDSCLVCGGDESTKDCGECLIKGPKWNQKHNVYYVPAWYVLCLIRQYQLEVIIPGSVCGFGLRGTLKETQSYVIYFSLNRAHVSGIICFFARWEYAGVLGLEVVKRKSDQETDYWVGFRGEMFHALVVGHGDKH